MPYTAAGVARGLSRGLDARVVAVGPVVVATAPGGPLPRLCGMFPNGPGGEGVATKDVVRHVLRQAGVERDAPVFVAAADYCVRVATIFAERLEDTERRLRPSHSIQMECSRLVQGFDEDSPGDGGWCGDLYLLCTPGRDLEQAIRSATAALADGAVTAVVVEVAVGAGGSSADALSAAAMVLRRQPVEEYA